MTDVRAADAPQGDVSAPSGLDRRAILRRGAVGAGATAAALAVPSITQLGIAPATAQACSTQPEPPIVSFVCNSTETVCAENELTMTLRVSDTVQTGSGLISVRVQEALETGSITVATPLSQTIPALCPGETVMWNPLISLDLCELFNQQLASAIVTASNNGVSLVDFDVTLSAMTIGGVAVADFSRTGIAEVESCPDEVSLPMQMARLRELEPVFDDVTCVYECPAAPSAGDVIFTGSTSYEFSAVLALDVEVDLAGFRGGAVTNLAGTITPAPCAPNLDVTVSCTEA